MVIEREIQPVKGGKGKYIKMLRNGTESKMVQQAKVEKARARGKEKERKAATEIERANLCATIGVKGMGTAAMLQLAISPTMARKEELKEKEKEQHHCQRKPLRKQRKKSWQW